MQFVSLICHPLLMATYMSIILTQRAPELFAFQAAAVNYFILAVFLTTCLIPAFSIFSLRLFSKISSLELTEREERPLPFLFIFIWYSLSTYLFITKLQLGPPFSLIIIAVTALIGLLFLITRWIKISIHSTAIWGSVGIIAALILTRGLLIQDFLYVFILLAGLTTSARLYLGYHQPSESWLGSILGFAFCFGAVFLFG